MEFLGAYLKKERESKGVTLEEIANSTHISIKFLKAIESDDFASMPNQTVARGFLRAYAKCICIDSNEVMNAYSENVKGFEQNKIPVSAISLKKKSKSKPVIAGLILTAIFIFVYLRPTNNQVKKNTETSSSGSARDVIVKPTEKIQGGSKLLPESQNLPSGIKLPDETEVVDRKPAELDALIAKVDKISDQSKPEATPTKVSDDELFLTIEAREEAWLNIVIDDVEIKDAILHPGEKIKWKATRSFLFSSGNKKGLDVFLQGKLIVFPEPQNRIIKNFMIDRSLLNNEMKVQAQ